MSTFILVLVIGSILVGGFILVAGFLFEDERASGGPAQAQLSEIKNPNRLLEMARTHENQDQWREAAQTWNRYLELEPDAAEAQYRRGLARLRADNFTGAVEDLETIRNHPDFSPEPLPLYLGRGYHGQGKLREALESLEDYLDIHPSDLGVTREAARLARTLEKPGRARQIYQRLRDTEDAFLQVEGSLALIEINLDENLPERAKPYLEELEDQQNRDNLTSKQQKEYLYQQARFQEARGNQSEADSLFRTLYSQDPEHRDVREIVEKKIENMSQDRLIENMVRLDRDQFLAQSERIVKTMGYQVVGSDSLNAEEIEISATEKQKRLKVSRVLFAFKKWTSQTGEFPLKEFELKLLENRYDHGFFVCPGGFNQKAIEYVKSSRAVELFGPDRLLGYLRKVEKERLK